MGREVVYCFKCQQRLIEEDFESGDAVRVGVNTSCKKCLPELIATLPPEQKMALLTGAPLPVTTPQLPPLKTLPTKTGPPAPEPRVHRPTQVTRTHRQASGPPMLKFVGIGIGAVIVVGVAALMMLGGDDPPDNNNHAVAPSTPDPAPVAKPPPPVKPDAGTPAKTQPTESEAKLNRVQGALRAAQAYREANPDDLEGIAKRLEAVMWNAERTPYFETAKKEFEEVSRQIAARAAPKPPPDNQPETKPAEADPETMAAKPEPPPTPPPEMEPKPEPVSVKPDPKPVVVVPPPEPEPEPEPALPELWKLLIENKAKLAGKTAPVALRPPFDKSKAVIENVSDTALEMSVAFGGGQAGATKKPEEIKAEEFRKLFVLAGLRITPELEKRLADLVAERERAKVEAAYYEALDKAEKHMAEEDWKGAVAALNEALRLKPGDPDAKRLLAQAGEKLAPKSLTLDLGNGVTMEFVYIKPGTFVMGGESTSEGRFQAVETPKHEVTITKGFYIGKHEVTQAQYEAVMGNNPSKSTRNPDCPADNVTWQNANAFCQKVAQKTGRQVRLPTEAEWEFACRAGTDTPWSHGSDPAALGEYAWYDGNAGGASHPVGKKKPNPWGLYDMHGNVCERIADWYHRDYYANSPKEDPTGPEGRFQGGGNGTTILRGGTWKSSAGECTSGTRLRGGGYAVYHNWGLRAAMTAPDE